MNEHNASKRISISFVQVCIFGTVANILNVMVLTKKDMAKAPINKILKWLAVADMLIMIEYIPFVSYQYIYMNARKYIMFHSVSLKTILVLVIALNCFNKFHFLFFNYHLRNLYNIHTYIHILCIITCEKIFDSIIALHLNKVISKIVLTKPHQVRVILSICHKYLPSNLVNLANWRISNEKSENH